MSTPSQTLSRGLIALFAFCCGAIVANIYYAQPIIELMAPDANLTNSTASLVVSLTQIGYAVGLFFLVPLADLVENRKLILATLAVSFASLLGTAFAAHPSTLLLTSVLIGLSSVAVQMIIPLAAHLTSEESRGRVVGSIMSGLLLGILLARPASSLVADFFGWRAVFMVAAGVMVVVAIAVALFMPHRKPAHSASYGALLASLWHLFQRQPVLRQRALYQALMFAAFSLFWTASPIALAREYGLSQAQIAVFALVGAMGAIAAPIAGRLADAGHTQRLSHFAKLLAVVAFVPGLVALQLHLSFGVVALAITGVLLDFAVQMNMVLGQRAVYALDPASRGRLNALYMTSIFIGGAVGSSVAGSLYEHAGWTGVALAGAAMPVIALLVFLKVSASAPVAIKGA